MGTDQLEAVQASLVVIVGLLLRLLEEPKALPVMLTKKRAAKELSVKGTTLKTMLGTGEISSVMVCKTAMIPSAEIHRLACQKLLSVVFRGKAKSRVPDTGQAGAAVLLAKLVKRRR